MNFVMLKKYNLTGSQEDEYFVSGVSRSNKPDFNLVKPVTCDNIF